MATNTEKMLDVAIRGRHDMTTGQWSPAPDAQLEDWGVICAEASFLRCFAILAEGTYTHLYSVLRNGEHRNYMVQHKF